MITAFLLKLSPLDTLLLAAPPAIFFLSGLLMCRRAPVKAWLPFLIWPVVHILRGILEGTCGMRYEVARAIPMEEWQSVFERFRPYQTALSWLNLASIAAACWLFAVIWRLTSTLLATRKGELGAGL